MKKSKIFINLLVLFFCFILNSSCSGNADSSSNYDTDTSVPDWKCGTHNGKQLWTGPRGGCYYYNSNGNKTYVDRSECNC